MTSNSNRVARLEIEADSMKSLLDEHKKSMDKLSEAQIETSKALVKLTMIADSNQKFIREFSPRVTKLEARVTRASGYFAGLLFVVALILKLS